MKTSELKPLVKKVLREMFSKQLNEGKSGELENYQIEFDDLVVPGISNETDYVTITIVLSYEATSGSPARGLSGPPEKSSPAEGPEVELVDWDFMSIEVKHQQGEPTVIDDFKNVTKEQFTALKKAVNNYIAQNQGQIEDQILEKLGNDFDDDSHHPGRDY